MILKILAWSVRAIYVEKHSVENAKAVYDAQSVIRYFVFSSCSKSFKYAQLVETRTSSVLDVPANVAVFATVKSLLRMSTARCIKCA